MNANQILKFILLLALSMQGIGCTNFRGNKSHSLEGHWISGQCYSYFVTDDRSYFMVDKSIPKEVIFFMKKQPSKPDPYTKGGEASAIFMEIECTLRKDLNLYPRGYEWVFIDKINSFRAAKSDFWSKSHPLPITAIPSATHGALQGDR